MRQPFGVSALGLLLLVAAPTIAPVRAQERAPQRPQEGQEIASQLLDGFGRYTLHEYARARDIMEPLAQHGNADAQQLVGSMYANGDGVSQDKVRAAHWYSLAAEQGKVDAQFALGIMYRDGAGVPRDRGLALKWLRRAAEKQHSDAANALGELYAGSDHAEAAAWFERAALMGNGAALSHLGMSALTKGGEHSDKQAYKWFALSAGITVGAQRDTAVRVLLALRERMMPLQIEAAKRLIRDWISLGDCDIQPDPDRARDRVNEEHERDRNLIRKREPAQGPRCQQATLMKCDRVHALVADDQRGSQPEGSESCSRAKQ
jgi:TPR repeat protein